MKRFYFVLVLIVLLSLNYTDIFAQGCSQCRMVPQSNLEGGGHVASGLNNGILYLLAMPYIFLTIVGVIYRKPIMAFVRRRRK